MSSNSICVHQTDGSIPNTLVIATAEIVKSRVAAAEHISQFSEDARSPFIKKHKTILHPGEVNRIRELPQNNYIVATHTDSPDVLIWDVKNQVNRQCVAAPKRLNQIWYALRKLLPYRCDLMLLDPLDIYSFGMYLLMHALLFKQLLTGHQDNAEFALSMCSVEPFVLSGGKDKSVVLWSIHDHVSSLAANRRAQQFPGSKDDAVTGRTGYGSTVQARGIFQGHEDDVEDVQFNPSRLKRLTVLTFIVLIGILSISIILTGSADNTVGMYDRRKLTSGGVQSPIHIFEGHAAAVLCVQWSPMKASVFGTSAEDGILNIWGSHKGETIRIRMTPCTIFLSAIGDMEGGSGTGNSGSPGLFFQHAGHRDKVVDFHWNASDPWTIVSVSDDAANNGGGGTLQGDELQVKVNKLSSTKTQLPYDYYFLKYCKPRKIQNVAENLGEVLRGDRIENSVYTFHMREEQSCTLACKVSLDAQAAKDFKEKIDDEYRVNMILDNLPVAVLRQRRDGSPSTTYEHGFRVGFKGNYAGSKEEKYFIHNHLSFRVMYHRDPETDSARIVGFEVTPGSINHEYKAWDEKNQNVPTCNQNTKNLVQGSTVPQEVDEGKEVIFSYDVTFKESDIKWASRWDTYLLMNDDQIHWFSIINSLMIVLFLSGMVAMIMMRTLYRDIANYNQLETQDEAQEETGWKLVHGDVFRPPLNSGLLCVYVGTGVQIFG
ncbi:UNVERIFIED_CONTAM: Transmembrane 9 superfamily member 7 [Sesamum calycinum]|uniref:Transmembrane 9 superfamily member n=1 Tax=Sesamum calycinum TaxID=2727403 RepID=A0AAW2NG90_9LAMI